MNNALMPIDIERVELETGLIAAIGRLLEGSDPESVVILGTEESSRRKEMFGVALRSAQRAEAILTAGDDESEVQNEEDNEK